MNKSMVRTALLSSASLVLPAVSAVIMPAQASAQTVCTADGSNNITCADGSTVVATGTASAGTTVNAVPEGLSTTSATDQTVTLVPGSATNNTITTNLMPAPGIILSATGALTLNASGVNVETRDPLSDALNLAGTSVTATIGNLRASDSGSDGLQVSSTGAIDIQTGNIQSVDRGVTISGGTGPIELTTGNVSGAIMYGFSVTGTGPITIDAGNVYGGLQAIGISGGAGAIDVSTGTVTSSDFSAGPAVEINGTGSITFSASGLIRTQAVDPGGHGLVINGGAGPISVTTANIETTSEDGDAMIITGTGSITLDVGDLTTTGNLSEGARLTGASISGTIGDITASGAQSFGLFVTGGVSDLTVGNISSTQDGVIVNGGSSPITLTVGDVSTTEFDADGVTLTTTGAVDFTGGTITTAGGSSSGLTVNFASDVDVTTTGVQTTGNNSDAVLLQSSGNLTTDLGIVTTSGSLSTGVYIQSTGNGTMSVGFDSVTTSGAGSTGVRVQGNLPGLNFGVVFDGGNVGTLGTDANAIQVFNAGTISGTIGDIFTNANNSSGLVATASGNVDLTIGDVDFGGEFSDGVVITSTAGDINVDIGTVTNHAGGASNDGVHLTGGLITATIDEIDISTQGGIALQVNATDDVDVTVGDVTNFSAGILINAAANNVDLTCGNVTTSNINTNSVEINATGTIDLLCGNISTAVGTSYDGSTSLDINGGAGAINATIGNVVQEGAVANAVEVSGTGPITLTTGNVTSDNYSSSAIEITGGAGAIDLTCGNITVQSQNNSGVRISGTGAIDVTCGNLTNQWATTSAGSDSLLAIAGGAGAINATVGNVTQTSGGSDAVVVSGTGPITLVTGNVTSTGPAYTELARGVVVQGGAGPINVTTGLLTTVAADSHGLEIDGTTGAITATVGGASIAGAGANAINSSSTTGSQTINVNGAISSVDDGVFVETTTGGIDINANANIVSSGGWAIYTDSAGGAATIDVAAGSTVTGSEGAIGFDGSGTGVVNNAGRVGLVDGVAVAAQVGVTVTVNNLAGATMNGRVDLSNGADSIFNAGTWNVTGPNRFLPGNDLVSNLAGGQINIAAGATFTGLETLTNAGTITAANGITFDVLGTALTNTGIINLAGVVDFGAGTDSFANTGAGILNLTGNASILGAETFTQSGRINLNTFTLTGPAIAFTNSGFIDTSGSAGMGGFTAFNNAGTLDLAPGIFTAPAALFTNSGTILADEGASTITGQTGFANSGTIDLQDGATGDVLTINSNFVGSGSSNLAIDVVGTATGNAADLLIVTGNISGTTMVNPTFLNPTIDPDGVLIVDGGGTLAANAFTLGNVTSQGLINYSLLTQGNDVFLATAANVAVFDIGLLGSMNQEMWYQSADAYLACAASRRNEFGVARSSPVGICGQLYVSRDRTGDQDRTATLFGDTLVYSDRVTTHRRGAQVDLGFRAGGNLHVGLTAGYGHAKVRQETGTDLDLEGHNIGAYAQYGSELGFYAGLMVKRDRYDARIANPGVIARMEVDAKSTGIDGELGWRTRGLGALIDLSGGLSYVKSKLDDFSAGNIAFDNDSATSLRGRLGARLGWSGDWAPFVGISLFHEFEDGDDIGVMSGTFADSFERRPRGTWARIEGGLGGGSHGGPLVTLWGDFGDVKGGGLRAGFRF